MNAVLARYWQDSSESITALYNSASSAPWPDTKVGASPAALPLCRCSIGPAHDCCTPGGRLEAMEAAAAARQGLREPSAGAEPVLLAIAGAALSLVKLHCR